MSEEETYGANIEWGVMHPIPEALKEVQGLRDYHLFPRLLPGYEYQLIPIAKGNVALAVVEAKGRQNMSRNQFENNERDEEPELFEVPLRLGADGPIIGTAKVDKAGQVYETTITDEEVKKQLKPPAVSFGLPDPADRYRVSQHQDEMDVPYGRPPIDPREDHLNHPPQ